MAFRFELNGAQIDVEKDSPATTLLDFLRQNGLTGSKEGCAEGECGACTVALLSRDAAGQPAWRSANSCLLLLPMLAGRTVVTSEGLAKNGEAHPAQTAMVAHNGSQCGYCTPGIVMSIFEGTQRPDLTERWQIEDQLAGNLCRCTGYRPITEAACAAVQSCRLREDAFTRRLTEPQPALSTLAYEAPGARFLRPQTIAETIEILATHPKARLVAGATEIGVAINIEHQSFPVLVSTEAISEMRRITCDDHEWSVGGAATLTEMEETAGRELPALAEILRWFGSRQIRNRATLAGNLATASPIGDMAPLMLALDATLVLSSKRGARVVAIANFFTGYRKTCLEPGEIITEIRFPRATPDLCFRAEKISKRREMDISVVSAAIRLEFDNGKLVRQARVAFGGVAATPLRVTEVEHFLLGKPWNAETARLASDLLRTLIQPLDDVRASAAYRLDTAAGLLKRFAEAPRTGLKDVSHLPQPAPRFHEDLAHESAALHANGGALYVDDIAQRRRCLALWPVVAPFARARITRLDVEAARAMPGVVTILLAPDVPGINQISPTGCGDEVMLAEGDVWFHGQIVAAIVAETVHDAREAARAVVLECEPLPHILTSAQAIAADSFHNEPHTIARGNFAAAFAVAPRRMEGEFEMGGQEHLYLETQASLAWTGEDGSVRIDCSTQHPSEIQALAAKVLNLPRNRVTVACPRMGGGFGGKETQSHTWACLAALAAVKTGRAVRARLPRHLDMQLTGKRHPFFSRFQIAFDNEGHLLAARVELFANGGWSKDLSEAICDRGLFHLDNSYHIPNVEFIGRVCKTNLVSHTAFRGFGGPQGMLVIEEIMARVAGSLGLPPETVRERNLYHGTGPTNTTQYGQEIGDNRIKTIWHGLRQSAAFDRRREEIAKWNLIHPERIRGIAMTPVKFGISFTTSFLNQAGALILIYQDGSVQVNHGGTEMGQGLHTKMRDVACTELGLPADRVRIMTTRTDKVPNTSATAASSGSDLNGQAVKNACDNLRERLAPVAAEVLRLFAKQESDPVELTYNNGDIIARFSDESEAALPFANIVHQAYLKRISLSATGYYRTPFIHYDRTVGRGRPFLYFACGAAVTEVEVDVATGAHQILRADILHDVGNSLNPAIDVGQIEGGYVQGAGWLTNEELLWDHDGVLRSASAGTYKIPSVGDAPRDFRVTLLPHADQEHTIHGSKAVGEPPLMLAISVREALRDAIAAHRKSNGVVLLASPATPEAVYRALQRMPARSGHLTIG